MILFSENPGLYLAFITGVLIGVIGLAVGLLGRFRGKYLAFALAEGGFGFGVAISNGMVIFELLSIELAQQEPGTYLLRTSLSSVVKFIGIIGLIALVRRHPDPLVSGVSWRRIDTATIVAAISVAVVARIGYFSARGWWDDFGWFAAVAAEWSAFDISVFAWVQIAVALVLGLQYVHSAEKSRRDYTIFAAALVVYPLTFAATALLADAGWRPEYGNLHPLGPMISLLTLLPAILLLLTTWTGAAIRTGDKGARGMVIWIISLTLASVIFFFTRPENIGFAGIARLIMAAVLLYGILRHDYLGLDIKVRWGLSKSTVAAFFVAAFFIASEVAQQFFGEQFNNNYVGIAAAGVLVLAIAPLQRVADRIATAAIPYGSPSATGGSADEIYRGQVEIAWANGKISANEKVMLRDLRKKLQMPAERAEDIDSEVERKHLN